MKICLNCAKRTQHRHGLRVPLSGSRAVTNVLVGTTADCGPAMTEGVFSRWELSKWCPNVISPEYGLVFVCTQNNSSRQTGTRRTCATSAMFPCVCARVRASRWIRSQRWLLSHTLHWAHSATAAEPYKRWKGQQRAKSNHLFAQASRDAEDWRTVQEKVFRGCILSALTSYVSNKKHTVKGFMKTVQEVWSQLPIGREHFHMKVTNKHQFWVSDQGVAVHKLWRQKNVFQPITKVETNSLWMYANTSINPQSQKVCIFAKRLVLFWFSECQVEVQEWQMNHPLFVDFSNPPLGSKRCPRMSIFFVYKDRKFTKTTVLSYLIIFNVISRMIYFLYAWQLAYCFLKSVALPVPSRRQIGNLIVKLFYKKCLQRHTGLCHLSRQYSQVIWLQGAQHEASGYSWCFIII